ncbi:MAG: phosphate ABC transporter permease PstA [Firmicutes bacterium]|nr:phosphate ABC transporter permease PstA [Dethiobacter sp.]MBS3887713.1 phosphate ABC transporter permease PstA [Bacillota bacterium]MBS4053828.1 phosphate ABC transporter permease PstA [Thermaerobacter sp.]
MPSNHRRRVDGRAAEVISSLFALAATLILGLILYFIARRGLGAINWTFLTSLPTPVGQPGGGIGNALIGSAIMIGIGTLLAVPWGVTAAIFLDQHPHSKLASATRFACRVLTGVPSLIIGLFVFTLLVLPTRTYSALAGGIALGVMMTPLITLSSETILATVSSSWREASYALGATKQQTVRMLILPTAAGGLTVGIMLAVALAAGQTAPVLLTALTSRFWLENLTQPAASLPVLIYTYGISPFPDWQSQAWGAALALVTIVLVLNIVSQAVVSVVNRRRGV